MKTINEGVHSISLLILFLSLIISTIFGVFLNKHTVTFISLAVGIVALLISCVAIGLSFFGECRDMRRDMSDHQEQNDFLKEGDDLLDDENWDYYI